MNIFAYIFSALFPFLFKSKLETTAADLELHAIAEKESKLLPPKPERYFYRNAGPNRAQRNDLRHRLKRAKTKAEKEFIKMILDKAPKNIPYQRNCAIYPQHVGTATPEHLIFA